MSDPQHPLVIRHWRPGLLRIALFLCVVFVFLAPLAVGAGEDKPAPPPAKDPKAEPSKPGEVKPAPRPGGSTAPSLPTGPRTPPRGAAREAMWKAPTARDWAKPCLLTFQRTWEDAVAVSKETGKPILVCVSMDGEIASEHYAGVRYREPAIAALYKPYVCVIASVYRHTPRDHDDQGRRNGEPELGRAHSKAALQPLESILERQCEEVDRAKTRGVRMVVVVMTNEKQSWQNHRQKKDDSKHDLPPSAPLTLIDDQAAEKDVCQPKLIALVCNESGDRGPEVRHPAEIRHQIVDDIDTVDKFGTALVWHSLPEKPDRDVNG